MRRAVPILSGLAILGVILNHSNWHALSRFAPGTAGGYFFIPMDQIGKFGVNAFIFIAGFFIAYATNGGQTDLRWSIVRVRLAALAWPWLIWSGLLLIGQAPLGRPISAGDFLRDLFIQYYFVPLLIFYYLLAPWLAHIARSNVRALLIGMAAVQLAGMLVFYARYYWPGFPSALRPWIDLGPVQYLRFAFFFPLGLAIGMFPDKAHDRLARWQPVLPWLAVLFGGLSIVEASIAYRLGGQLWPGAGDQAKLTSVLYSLALILSFVGSQRLWAPVNRLAVRFSAHSYGYYLCHYVILGALGRLIGAAWPWLDGQLGLLWFVLFALTTACSIVLVEGWARLPVISRFHRYVFG